MKTFKNYSLMAFLLLCMAGFTMQSNAQCNSDCPSLITNGDFESGNTGFTSGLAFSGICGGGTYSVETFATDKCTNFPWQMVPGNSGDFMVVDGRNNTSIWGTNVSVTAGNTYQFNYWAYPDVSLGDGPILRFRVAGATIAATDLNLLTFGAWNEICVSYTATTTGSVFIELYEQYPGSRQYTDYGLDDISFRPTNCNADPCDIKNSFNFQVERCEVMFNSSSISVPSGIQIVGIEWTFGDGYSSTDPNPTHYYDTPGVYDVCVTITTLNPKTGECCTREFCEEIRIEEQCEKPCELDGSFKFKIDNCTGTFSSGVTSATNILGWYWDFGDGTTGTGSTVIHTYNSNTTYVVCLTVVAESDEGCCTYTVCEQVEIRNCDGSGDASSRIGATQNTSNANSFHEGSLSIYPNPAGSTTNITYIVEQNASINLAVFDVKGQLMQTVITENGAKLGTYKAEVNTEGLAPGVYVVRFTNGTTQKSTKFIVE